MFPDDLRWEGVEPEVQLQVQVVRKRKRKQPQQAAKKLPAKRFDPNAEQKQLQQQRYFCFVCGRSYRYRRNLNRHINLDCGREPRHPCPYCDYVGRDVADLREHVLDQHQAQLLQQGD